MLEQLVMRQQVFTIQRLLRRLQIVNRFFEEDFYTGLPALQSLLLIEIDSNPTITATELCKVFALEKSIISRALSSLVKKKLIERKQDLNDARKLTFKITKKGDGVLEVNDSHSNQFVDKQLECFTNVEIKKFTNYFQKFCDGLSLNNSIKRKHDSDLRVAIRRYTKGIRLVHSTYLTSGLTPSQWFVLEEIYWSSPGGTTPSVLSEKLRLPPSSMNQILNVLEESKLIQKSESIKNKRETIVLISQKGIKLFLQVEADTYAVFSKSLNAFSDVEAFEFARLIRKYIKEIEPGEVWLDNETVVNELTTPRERKFSRGFIVTQYVNNKEAENVPETVIGSHNAAFSLVVSGDLKGVIEIDRKSLAILNLSSLPDVNKHQLRTFIEISSFKTRHKIIS